MSLLSWVIVWVLISPFVALFIGRCMAIGSRYDEAIAAVHEGLDDVTEKS